VTQGGCEDDDILRGLQLGNYPSLVHLAQILDGYFKIFTHERAFENERKGLRVWGHVKLLHTLED